MQLYDVFAWEGHSFVCRAPGQTLINHFRFTKEALARLDKYEPGEAIVFYGNGRSPNYVVTKTGPFDPMVIEVIKE